MTSFKEQLIEIVGQDNVLDSPDVLEMYSKDKSFTNELAPSMVVKVRTASEVQDIVSRANQTKTPLIPISSGFPHHRGDTVPSVPGAVIVDLSGMKRIISVNQTHRMAIVEPGVTYGELQTELAKHGLTLPMSLAPRATKSVLASVLETEPRLNSLHQWCLLDPIRCVEVIWGDGNRMYTGEAGGSAMDLEQQWAAEKWQIEPTGPFMLDFYRMLTGAQGTMGIVTWASVKCENLPQIHKMYSVSGNTLDDLMDFAYKIIRFRFSNEFFLVNSSYLAGLLGETPDEIASLRGQLPEWIALVGIAGHNLLPEERVAAQEADIAEMAAEFGLKMAPGINGISGEKVLNAISQPSGKNYWKETYKGAFQDIFFTTTLDRSPTFLDIMRKQAEKNGYPLKDIGIYLQPQNMGTSYHCEFTLPYNENDPQETRRMRALFENASCELSSMGAYFLRPYGLWSRLQLNRDAQSYAMLKKLRAIFDPNGIMNPGKLCNN